MWGGPLVPLLLPPLLPLPPCPHLEQAVSHDVARPHLKASGVLALVTALQQLAGGGKGRSTGRVRGGGWGEVLCRLPEWVPTCQVLCRRKAAMEVVGRTAFPITRWAGSQGPQRKG